MGKFIGALAVILLGVGVFFGYQYYNNTYKTTTAYAKIPEIVPEKIKTKDMSGDIVENSYTYEYDVTFVKENGETTKRTFDVSGENPQPLKPGSYIKAEISNERVNAPTEVAAADVPNSIKEQLNAGSKQ